MQGLVLEGGGAKGAFHVGALKALFEKGYSFDGVMGTSIGAINGAMVAQGDFDLLYELWGRISPSTVLGLDEEQLTKLKDKIDRASLKYLWSEIRKAVSGKGLSTERFVNLVDTYINEDKLRASPCDFGIVTVDTSENWMPVEIFKSEMPEGMLKDYIVASAYFPAFKRTPINGRSYMDGGIYDNMPINPLVRKGYDRIIVLRTGSSMPHRKVIDPSVKITYINPSEPLGRTLDFSNEKIQYNIRLGYYDCLKQLDGLAGTRFYLYPLEPAESIDTLEKVDYSAYLKLSKTLGVAGSKRVILDALAKVIGINEDNNIGEGFIRWLEPYAEAYELPRFRLYSLEDFIRALTSAVRKYGVERINDNKKLLHKEIFAAFVNTER